MPTPALVILIYAAILVIGGFVGWRLSGSRISLTASLISAALLSFAYRLSRTSPGPGYLMGTIITVGLAVMFTLRFRKTKKFMPSGMLLALSVIVLAFLLWSTMQFWHA